MLLLRSMCFSISSQNLLSSLFDSQPFTVSNAIISLPLLAISLLSVTTCPGKVPSVWTLFIERRGKRTTFKTDHNYPLELTLLQVVHPNCRHIAVGRTGISKAYSMSSGEALLIRVASLWFIVATVLTLHLYQIFTLVQSFNLTLPTKKNLV